tara:strand:- start:91 stop:393 length:303 start_codon:yes stop_codon:yes gene_type:complete
MGLTLSTFTAENSESDFYYRYARFTLYVDTTEDGVDINHITRGPFGERISLYDIDDFIRQKMVDDLGSRIKKGGSNNMTRRKKRVLRSLQMELRNSIISD